MTLCWLQQRISRDERSKTHRKETKHLARKRKLKEFQAKVISNCKCLIIINNVNYMSKKSKFFSYISICLNNNDVFLLKSHLAFNAKFLFVLITNVK